MELRIKNMTCGGCAQSVTKAIQSIDPSASVEPNLVKHAVKVETTASQTVILQVLEEAGYPAAVN